MPDMRFAPNSLETERALRVLKEISAICRREGIVIAHQKAGIVLATAPSDTVTQSVLIGVANLIAPDCYTWAPLEWRNPLDMRAGKWQTEKTQ
jgi:hypothetical protein